jgi:hypothetical protein
MKGRPPSPLDPRRREIFERFGVPLTRRRLWGLTEEMMDQIDRCKDDSARRIMLGVSK